MDISDILMASIYRLPEMQARTHRRMPTLAQVLTRSDHTLTVAPQNTPGGQRLRHAAGRHGGDDACCNGWRGGGGPHTTPHTTTHRLHNTTTPPLAANVHTTWRNIYMAGEEGQKRRVGGYVLGFFRRKPAAAQFCGPDIIYVSTCRIHTHPRTLHVNMQSEWERT